eukprot:symbB.v1.2.018819.t1/scaffold1516.1/size114181/7
MDEVPPLSYDRQSNASQLSTARSSNGGLTARSGTPRDHERRPLKELPRSRWALNDVPRLRLGGQMASPRSSSSGVYTSRSELFEPQSSVSASGSNREVQDLCREMEAMRLLRCVEVGWILRRLWHEAKMDVNHLHLKRSDGCCLQRNTNFRLRNWMWNF